MKNKHCSEGATLWTSSMDNWSNALDSLEFNSDVENKIVEAAGQLNETEISDRLRSFGAPFDQETLKRIIK